MSGWEIGLDSPWYLLLLGLLPCIWGWSARSLSGLGTLRWALANTLRSTVLVLIVLALAEVQVLKSSHKVTVLYLLDQSESIPLDKRQAMLEYTISAVARHRNKSRQDRAGVIVFGRNANIEIPPFDDDIVALGAVGSYLNLLTDATNLEAAFKLAKASFPEDSAKRIVVVTDGNENFGDVRALAATLADDGIGVDAAPIRLELRPEVALEKITLPADIRRGQPVETRVVVQNHAARAIRGRLKVTRRVGAREEFLSEQEVELPPGKHVYAFSHTIEQVAMYTYQAVFSPLDPRDDMLLQNNVATAFTHVRGKGHVLLIEDWQHPGEFAHLVDRLRQNNIEVSVQPSDKLYTNLAELQTYDSIILANVPRSSGDDAQSVSSFSEQQIALLVRNTEQMGGGLVMLGGPNSFGAGGWSNTPIEKAMPVDFQIKNSKIRAIGALALIMHASELADGNYWQKEVAKQAILSLGPMDYCGLVHWDMGGDTWLWRDPQGNGMMQVGTRRNLMLSRLGTMSPGDMPEFDPAMKMVLGSFQQVSASVKLMIVISDGDPSPPSSATVAGFRQAGIQVTTVAIGAHGPAGHRTLQALADNTGGRYYRVTNAKALPKIYVSEVRRVARPLIYEPETPVRPQVTQRHEIVAGIKGPLPPISGFVLTTVKDNPLVEVAAISPQPDEPRNATILAAWTYGLGRTAVLTTDAGKRWASSWTDWENYDKLFTQLVRWSMRSINEQGQFTLAADARDGKIRVVVTALDKENEFLNFLNMSAVAIDPDLEPVDFTIQQQAPGRYVGEFDAPKQGNYFLTVHPGPSFGPLVGGVNVPYSAEYRQRETNRALLATLVRTRPKGGQAGALIEGDLQPGKLDSLLKVNSFRGGLAPATSRQDVWPLVTLAATCLFFADVLARRLSFDLSWIARAWVWLRASLFSKTRGLETDERLERLRSRKTEIAEQIDELRATARFEPLSDATSPQRELSEVLDEATGQKAAPATAEHPPAQLTPATPEAESYTERLLRAKRQARQDLQKHRDLPEP